MKRVSPVTEKPMNDNRYGSGEKLQKVEEAKLPVSDLKTAEVDRPLQNPLFSATESYLLDRL